MNNNWHRIIYFVKIKQACGWRKSNIKCYKTFLNVTVEGMTWNIQMLVLRARGWAFISLLVSLTQFQCPPPGTPRHLVHFYVNLTKLYLKWEQHYQPLLEIWPCTHFTGHIKMDPQHPHADHVGVSSSWTLGRGHRPTDWLTENEWLALTLAVICWNP